MPSGEDFRCIESTSTSRSGLRVLDLQERQFYEFAVHQFTAKYGIHSAHPLFFHFVTDPLARIEALMLTATLNFHVAISYYVGFSLLLCALGQITLEGVGKS